MPRTKPTATAEVKMDRRSTSKDRRKPDSRKKQQPVAAEVRKPTEERRKVQRRRQIDPTTCERDYTNEEVEFMRAMDEYKRRSGRMFPTCSEILEVIRGLGYQKPGEEISALVVEVTEVVSSEE